jgi:hypothetical protein
LLEKLLDDTDAFLLTYQKLAKGGYGAEDWVILENAIKINLSSIQVGTLEQMLRVMKNSGDEGLKLANKLEQGTFSDVLGYIDLVKKSSTDIQSIKAVNQALECADNVYQLDKSKKRFFIFENDLKNGFHDVDFGIVKTTKPEPKDLNTTKAIYAEAYQFKTLDGVLNKDKIQKASRQLKEVTADKKILEFKCSTETTLSDINNPAIIDEMKFQASITDVTKGSKITEFHFILADGSKIIKIATQL